MLRTNVFSAIEEATSNGGSLPLLKQLFYLFIFGTVFRQQRQKHFSLEKQKFCFVF